ncbi:MAG: acyl-CoA dehydrogenase, partial [Rubrivivax sp.]
VRHRIGEEGMGFIYQMQQFQEERLDGAARRLASIELIQETADYLRQRARTTVADQALEARLREFLLPGEQVTMQHYIAER